MAQRVTVFATKPDDLSVFPLDRMVERKWGPTSCPDLDLYVCAMAFTTLL